jgi:outer membrane receptor protein involved in Fe transport
MNDWAAGLSAYYIGAYADTTASINEATYQSLGQPDYVYKIDGVYYWRVEDSVTLNAFGSRTFNVDGNKWLSDLTVRIGVKNLLNEEPPLTTDLAGYDPAVYNSVAAGRTWTLRFSKAF